MIWAHFNSVLSEDGKYLFVSNTRNYLITLLDLEKGEILRTFERKYKRVKYEKNKWDKEFYKLYHPPEKKFEDDILDLFINNGFLWVKTSTRNKEKVILFDVFNFKGSYLEKSYINLKGELMAMHGDFAFAIERNIDGKFKVNMFRFKRKEQEDF